MTAPDLFQGIVERLQSAATVKTVYGDPIEANGKTIIPVARVRYGFGGGGGSRKGDAAPEEGGAPQDTGHGGGGGVEVSPEGVIEITQDQTRYISIGDRRRLIRAALVGFLLALFLLRRRRRA